jgi:hypothetical protein
VGHNVFYNSVSFTNTSYNPIGLIHIIILVGECEFTICNLNLKNSQSVEICRNMVKNGMLIAVGHKM